MAVLVGVLKEGQPYSIAIDAPARNGDPGLVNWGPMPKTGHPTIPSPPLHALPGQSDSTGNVACPPAAKYRSVVVSAHVVSGDQATLTITGTTKGAVVKQVPAEGDNFWMVIAP